MTGDVHPSDGTASIPWLFFGLKGRINRLAYMLSGLMMLIVEGFLLYRFALVDPESSAGMGWAMAFAIGGLVALWSTFALSVKRLHDFGKPAAFAIFLFIPAVSILAFLILCVVPGSPDANDYGEHTNSTG